MAASRPHSNANPKLTENTSDHTYQSIEVEFFDANRRNNAAAEVHTLSMSTWNMLNRCVSKKTNSKRPRPLDYNNNPWDIDEDFDEYIVRKNKQIDEIIQQIDSGLIKDVMALQEVDFLSSNPPFPPLVGERKNQFEALRIRFEQALRQRGWGCEIHPAGTQHASKKLFATIYDTKILMPNKNKTELYAHNLKGQKLVSPTGAEIFAGETSSGIVLDGFGLATEFRHQTSGKLVTVVNMHLDYAQDFNERITAFQQEQYEAGKLTIMAGDTNKPSATFKPAHPAILVANTQATNIESHDAKLFINTDDKTGLIKNYDWFTVCPTNSSTVHSAKLTNGNVFIKWNGEFIVQRNTTTQALSAAAAAAPVSAAAAPATPASPTPAATRPTSLTAATSVSAAAAPATPAAVTTPASAAAAPATPASAATPASPVTPPATPVSPAASPTSPAPTAASATSSVASPAASPAPAKPTSPAAAVSQPAAAASAATPASSAASARPARRRSSSSNSTTARATSGAATTNATPASPVAAVSAAASGKGQATSFLSSLSPSRSTPVRPASAATPPATSASAAAATASSASLARSSSPAPASVSPPVSAATSAASVSATPSASAAASASSSAAEVSAASAARPAPPSASRSASNASETTPLIRRSSDDIAREGDIAYQQLQASLNALDTQKKINQFYASQIDYLVRNKKRIENYIPLLNNYKQELSLAINSNLSETQINHLKNDLNDKIENLESNIHTYHSHVKALLEHEKFNQISEEKIDESLSQCFGAAAFIQAEIDRIKTSITTLEKTSTLIHSTITESEVLYHGDNMDDASQALSRVLGLGHDQQGTAMPCGGLSHGVINNTLSSENSITVFKIVSQSTSANKSSLNTAVIREVDKENKYVKSSFFVNPQDLSKFTRSWFQTDFSMEMVEIAAESVRNHLISLSDNLAKEPIKLKVEGNPAMPESMAKAYINYCRFAGIPLDVPAKYQAYQNKIEANAPNNRIVAHWKLNHPDDIGFEKVQKLESELPKMRR